MKFSRLLRLTLAATLTAAAAGCGGGEGVTVPPTTGILEITTSTSGTELDADGYTVQIDAEAPQAIAAAATLEIPEVTPGNHTVLLGGLAANCTVSGDNPRAISVTAGETATIGFAVTCSATTGSLSITSATSGSAPDADGYVLFVDGADRGALGANAGVTIGELVPGTHVVGLGGVAANCQIEGENLRPVTVTAGTEASVAYTIACAAPPPGAGSIRITTTTSGPDTDPDGYTFAVDGGSSQPLALNGSTTLTNLATGDHSVQLAGVAENCTVQGTNPQSVTVTSGATADVNFDISCSATTGIIRVSVTTSGSPTDPDGYVAKLDGGDPGLPIGTGGDVSFTSVPAGSHTVTLTGLATNCNVTGGPSRDITVTAGATSELSFVVTCASTTGSIQVTTVTTGTSLDPDGYTVSVDGGASQAIGPNATLTLEGLALGTHALTLSNIAGNCHLDGENPRVIEVLPGSITVTFDLNCLGANALIAFTSNAFQLLAIFVVSPDGSGLRNLTPDDARESNPIWSPDGRKILFSKNDGLYVMNSDGSGRVNLADGDQGIFEHRWSPDGRMIAFVAIRQEGLDEVDDLWAMQADGNGKVKLAEHAFNFSWSRDGRIVYTSDADLADVHLRIINADGSGDVRLTNRAAFQPAWSPDGGQIAFVTLGDKDIFLINPDGSGEVNLTQGLSDDDSPTWSPDGSRIAFTTEPLDQALESEVAVMNRDGSSRMNLTNRPGFDLQPSWSPDGTKIVFVGSDNGDSEIYVMNADGGNQTNVSNRPDSRETTPDWNGQPAVTVASRQQAFYSRWLRANQLEADRLHR
jgi:Tol biopolymer transport system component